jgi:16S rRNA (cytidine1402-2'-O)-methyltransferase
MGKLSIVSTPIGNLDDITIRAIKALFTAEIILCEDTRHTGILLQELSRRYGEQFELNPDWKPRLIPYYDEIEEKKIPEIISFFTAGQHVALVSDAGTPLISDPGFRLVRECIKRGIPVESIPGPSAILAALTSSGLPTDNFFFLGYPAEKQVQRVKTFFSLLQCFKTLKHTPTVILYCAPHKLLQTLEDMEQVFGDHEIVIARELTKVHEEIWRGTIINARKAFTGPKGEFVILFRIS